MKDDKEIEQMVGKWFGEPVLAVEAEIQSLIDTRVREAESAAIKRVMSRIDSHGFYGLMTGEYELKKLKEGKQNG